MMCRVLKVSRSGYYAWTKRPAVTAADERRSALLDRIEEIHAESRGTYGSPRVHAELQRDGVDVSLNTVARLMRDAGLTGRIRRKFKVTTDSRHDNPLAENVLNRRFEADIPDSAWCADIKAVPTRSGWVYLAAIIDVATRLVVGWSMARHMESSLVIAAFEDAVGQRVPASELIHHSDRGSQYTSAAYREALEGHDVTVSMSRKGDCWDNALMESFFGTYAQEYVLHESFGGLMDARLGTMKYIGFYNNRRLHSSLGYRTPREVDAQLSMEVVA